jgi:tetratricopeptide (TPR) repeat protein
MFATFMCVGLLLVPPAQPTPEPDPLPQAYAQALATYRDGDLWGAVALLGTIRDTKLDDAAEALWIPGTRSHAEWLGRIRTAIVLLTEAWFLRNEKGPALRQDPYLASARALARKLVRMAEDRRGGIGDKERRFARDWYLLVVSYRHGAAQVGWSRAYLAEARELFPNDPEVLLVSGVDHEIISEMSKGYLPRVDSTGQTLGGDVAINPGNELEQAETFLRQAAALSPGLVEARLRLGRVLYRRGELADAARELQAALTLTAQEEVQYLASTFLGMVAVARGDLDGADRCYADALRRFPGAHAAMIGRSEAAYLRGRSAEAAEIIISLLQQERTDDPWWLYLAGDWWHFEARLLALRTEVRR